MVVIAILLVSFAIGVWLGAKNEVKPKEESLPGERQVKKVIPFTQVMGGVLKTKAQIQEQRPTSACTKNLSYILETPLDEINESISTQDLTFSDECMAELSTGKATFFKDYVKSCVVKGKLVTKMTKECEYFLGFLRSYLLAEDARKKSLKEKEINELMANLVWNFMKDKKITLDTINDNLAIADELIAREPNLYSAHKAKLVSLFLKEVEGKVDTGEEFDKTVDDLKAFNEVDPELNMLPAVKAIAKDRWDQLNEYAEKTMREEPKNYFGPYAKSAYFWHEKNQAEAIQYLEKSIALNKTDKDLLKTMEGLKTGDFALGHYQLKLGFRFDEI